jgi:hypothetical protein
VLAAFDDMEHIERGYILLLEGLFMILFRTFHLQRSSKWATRASSRLFSKVCERKALILHVLLYKKPLHIYY